MIDKTVEALKLAKEGMYTKQAIKKVVTMDYINTLQRNKGEVGKTLREVSRRYEVTVNTVRNYVGI